MEGEAVDREEAMDAGPTKTEICSVETVDDHRESEQVRVNILASVATRIRGGQPYIILGRKSRGVKMA